MDIRKIEYFIKVAEVLNYSKAAEQLHISHQALSRQIQILENEIGAKLLERTTTKVTLTEVGKKTYDIFKPLLRDMYRSYNDVLEFVRYKKDTLRIGYFNGISYKRVVAPIINGILDQRPGLRIDMLSTDIGLIRELLEQDSIDLAIALMFDENDWEHVTCVPLFDAPLKIIVSDKHPWYSLDTVSLEQIADAPMLVYENRPLEGNEAFLHNLKVRERIPVRNVDTYMNLLERGDAFGIVGDIYSRREGNFRLLPLPSHINATAKVIVAFKKLHPICADLQF